MKHITVIALSPVPKRKPLNAPTAALNALFVSEESLASSPMKAPKNGPMRMKIGPRKKDATRPMLQPHVAASLPPDFFVMIDGKI